MKKEVYFNALGTLNIISVEIEEEDLLVHIVEDIKHLDDLFSIFKEESEISQINRNAGLKSVKVSKDTFEIIQIAKFYGEKTNGAFDITSAPLSELWGIHKGSEEVPSFYKIYKARKLVNYQDIILDQDECSVFLKRKNMKIDLGSIAKGYCVDRVKKKLHEAGVNKGFINFGGSVYTFDKERVGIQDPFKKRGESFMSIDVDDACCVTSGSYEHSFKKNGKIYHHIIDPFTGYPSDKSLSSVTLVGSSAMLADIYTTAFYVLGIEEGMKILKDDYQSIFVLDNKDIFLSKDIKKQVEAYS